MAEDPTPIRPGVAIGIDQKREWADYLLGRLEVYEDKFGELPTSCAIVFTGPGGSKSLAHTWGTDNDSRSIVCAIGSMLLTKRGIGKQDG